MRHRETHLALTVLLALLCSGSAFGIGLGDLIKKAEDKAMNRRVEFSKN